jgi:Rieske Fe-S protein/predicted phosphodiesterase
MKDNLPGNEGEEERPQPNQPTRRHLLKCMAAWTGTGIVWTIGAGGLLTACGELASTSPASSPTPPTASAAARSAGFSFIQISDTHIGFNADGVNTDVNGTLQQVIAKINTLPQSPAFVLHTGDVSHNSRAAEFDTAYQLMKTIKAPEVFYVPGEHDVLNDQGASFRQRFLGKPGAKSWYSLDIQGFHFIGLSNSGELDDFGLLGTEQLTWLQQDLASLKKDTPIVVFAHVPLFTVYKPWSWETKDAARAITLLKPFSAVTVLNGHIHQVVTQVEGNLSFYTANATSFPQHRPGVGQPNAYKLPASELLQSLGYRNVNVVKGNNTPAITDTTLAGTPASTLAITVSSTTPTLAPAVTAPTNPGFLDVGPEADFSGAATTPRQVTLPPRAGKTDPQTAFILKENGQYVGLSDICTHLGCEVSWVGSDSRFECPCHGSQYDITGKNIAGPAPRPLARYKTQLVNGQVLISYEPLTNG